MGRENVMPFKRESQGPSQAPPQPPEPPDQSVNIFYTKGSQDEETLFGIKNVGVDPSGTFLILSNQKSSTFLKLSEIDRVEIEVQKVDLVG